MILSTSTTISTPQYFSGSTQYRGIYKTHQKQLNKCLCQLLHNKKLELRVSRQHEFYTLEKIDSIKLNNLIKAIYIFIVKICKEGCTFVSTAQNNLKNLSRDVLQDFPIHAMYLLQNDLMCESTSLTKTLLELEKNHAVAALSAIVPDESGALEGHITKLKTVIYLLFPTNMLREKIYKPHTVATVQSILQDVYADNGSAVIAPDGEPRQPKALGELTAMEQLSYQMNYQKCFNINELKNKLTELNQDCTANFKQPTPQDLSSRIQKAFLIREAAVQRPHSKALCQLLEQIDSSIQEMWSQYEENTGTDANEIFDAHTYRQHWKLIINKNKDKNLPQLLARELAVVIMKSDTKDSDDKNLKIQLDKLILLTEMCQNKEELNAIKKSIECQCKILSIKLTD